MKMAGYVYNDLRAVKRELGLWLLCWGYWKREVRKEIEDAVNEAGGGKERMSLDEWVRELLCELNEKRKNSGYREKDKGYGRDWQRV